MIIQTYLNSNQIRRKIEMKKTKLLHILLGVLIIIVIGVVSREISPGRIKMQEEKREQDDIQTLEQIKQNVIYAVSDDEVAEYIKNMLWKRKKIYSYMGGAGKTIFVSDTNWYPIINSKIHEITDQEFEFFSLEARKSRAYIYMFLTDECDVNIMITKNDYSDNKQPLNCRFIEDVFYR